MPRDLDRGFSQGCGLGCGLLVALSVVPLVVCGGCISLAIVGSSADPSAPPIRAAADPAPAPVPVAGHATPPAPAARTLSTIPYPSGPDITIVGVWTGQQLWSGRWTLYRRGQDLRMQWVTPEREVYHMAMREQAAPGGRRLNSVGHPAFRDDEEGSHLLLDAAGNLTLSDRHGPLPIRFERVKR